MLGMHLVSLLLALGAGYLVLYFAKREERGLRILGLVIGTFILTVAAILILGQVIGKGSCPMMGKMGKMGKMMPMEQMPSALKK